MDCFSKNELLDKLQQIIGDQEILTEEPMEKHTTFRTGGKASVFLKIQTTQALSGLLSFLTRENLPYFILGNGSNLLVSDQGYHGIIIRPGDQLFELKTEKTTIMASAGLPLAKIAHLAYEHSLTGMEFASGIPGTLGGALVMNAGAYDGEMKQITKEVYLMDRQGQSVTLDCEEMQFGYRSSILKSKPYIVLGAKLCLEAGNKDKIREKMDDFSARRYEKQPLDYPSAGSTFKRPEGMFAGKLIMDAGLRGASVGGAQVSKKHGGFIINKDHATSTDIYRLIGQVQKTVRETSGVLLEPEVIFLGEF